MASTWDYYYNIIFLISSFSGSWPYQKRKIRLIRVILQTVMSLGITIPEIAYQIKCKEEVNYIQCFVRPVATLLLSLISVVKLWTIQLNISSIRKVTQGLFDYWKELRTSEYKIIKSYAENTRQFSVIYSIYTIFATFGFVMMSFIPFILDKILPHNETRRLLSPIPAYFFIDEREYFFEIFWMCMLLALILVIGVIAHDCMFVCYIEHVCSMFAVVGFYYEQLFFCNKEMENININLNNIYYKRIAFSVHTHQTAIKYAQLLEDTYTITFAIQITIVILGMTTSMLQLLQTGQDFLESVRFSFFIGAQLIHLFCLSFEGQRLIDHSLRLRDQIYNSSWYNSSTKLQKLLMLVMMKSLQPCQLSAGKIYILSMQSFATVLQTSVSYLTVLMSV